MDTASAARSRGGRIALRARRRGGRLVRRARRPEPGWGRLSVMPTKVILDVDTGTDDAVALMVAALSPDIELVGGDEVNGNTAVEAAAPRTRSGSFEWIGLPGNPVHRGMSRPLARPQTTQLNPAGRIHGDLLELPPATPGAGARTPWTG